VILPVYYQVSAEVSKLVLPAFKRRPAKGGRFFAFGWKPITKKLRRFLRNEDE